MPRYRGHNIARVPIPLSNREVDNRLDLLDHQSEKKLRAVRELEAELRRLAEIRAARMTERNNLVAQAARLDEEIVHLDALIGISEDQITKELNK